MAAFLLVFRLEIHIAEEPGVAASPWGHSSYNIEVERYAHVQLKFPGGAKVS